ncbi:MAG: hypothetical protein FWE24_03000 [Defluviitaleaceae bacterium]|nr:hypothetical protein [Defluviitaleaceae bacterium]
MTFESAMNEALNDGKYSYLTGRFEDIGERIVNFIANIINFFLELFFNVEFAGFGQGVNTDVVSGIFIAFSIFVIGLLIFLIVRMLLKVKVSKKMALEEIFDDFRSNKLSFDEIMNLAAKHDSEKNFKEAARYRYIGLIMLFNSKEIVTVTDSMTGAQFERQAAKNMPYLKSGVRDTVNMYYNLFFGHKAISLEDYKAYLADYKAVMEEAQLYEKN